jgi:pimeloyl-ACP methyl ester carboxylesterase
MYGDVRWRHHVINLRWRKFELVLSAFIAGAATLFGCRTIPPPKTPIDTIYYRAEHADAKTLLVFLPGYGSAAQDFDKRGLIESVRTHQPSIDMLAVDAHFGYYESRTLVERLWQDAITPAIENGYEEIWLVGTSMGGLGAIVFSLDHAEAITGLVLLSPYLGPRDLISAIEKAGGLAAWTPERNDDVFEQIWTWLKEYQNGRARPKLILAYGVKDRLSRSHELLARILPADRVLRVEGGHGWRVWKPLWEEILSRKLVPENAGAEMPEQLESAIR